MGLATVINRRADSCLVVYYGNCLKADGTEGIIPVKATSEVSARNLLHAAYGVRCVLDICTERPATLREVGSQTPRKYHGRCLRADGTEISLIVKATSEAEACTKLHTMYRIQMVLDLVSAEQEARRRSKSRYAGVTCGVPRLI